MNFSTDNLTTKSSGDSLHRAGSALASDLAEKKDNIIRICVSEALGSEAWMIGDIAPRMMRVKIEGQESETITLDGNPLLKIWPPEMKTAQEGDSIKLVATCKYRTFKALNEKSSESAGQKTEI